METTETLDKLVHTILNDAEAEAEKIISESRREKDKILKEAEEESERRRQRIESEAKAEADLLKKREVARAGLQNRMNKLEIKEKLIDQVFAQTLEKLQEFTKEPAYSSYLEQLTIEGGVGLGGGELQIQTNQNDSSKLQNLPKLEQEITNQTKTQTKLTHLPERLNSVGGVVLKTTDGSILIDNTFEAKIARQRREIRVMISKSLFDD